MRTRTRTHSHIRSLSVQAISRYPSLLFCCHWSTLTSTHECACAHTHTHPPAHPPAHPHPPTPTYTITITDNNNIKNNIDNTNMHAFTQAHIHSHTQSTYMCSAWMPGTAEAVRAAKSSPFLASGGSGGTGTLCTGLRVPSLWILVRTYFCNTSKASACPQRVKRLMRVYWCEDRYGVLGGKDAYGSGKWALDVRRVSLWT